METIQELKSKALSLILYDFDSLKKIVQQAEPIEIFVDKEEDLFIIQEIMNYYKAYNEKPSLKNIYVSLAEKDLNKASMLKARCSTVDDKTGKPEELNYILDKLKTEWAKNKMVESIQREVLEKADKPQTAQDVSNIITKVNSELLRINNKIMSSYEGEYSFTTRDVSEKIENIKNYDSDKIRRFKISHDALDAETSGFTYGEIFLILGNIGQGKSMILSNIAFNLWFNGANVLLLTAEMLPHMFDQRIYSRASAVPYNNIQFGKRYLTGQDMDALEAMRKEFTKEERKNQIITKYLYSTDNVNTVEKYMDDLEKIHGFVPDVLLVDSFECLSPVKRFTDSWENLGQVVNEFKALAESYKNKRGLFITSTHQAKTETLKKPFREIDITDVGKSKIIAEKADAAIYVRKREDLGKMNIKVIKARRFKGVNYNMAIDFSKVHMTSAPDDDDFGD